MLRAVCTVVLALSLAACSGDGDGGDASDPSDAAAATSASGGTTAADATSTTPSAGLTTPKGAPPMEDPNFPDVYATLAPGSSAEADTGEDENLARGQVRITIDDIRDSVEPQSPLYEIQLGNRLWVVDVTVESVGGGAISLPEWTLATTDGAEHEPVFGTEIGDDLLFLELANGEAETAALVFELPSEATIAWLHVDPSIYVGRNIIFTP